MLSPFKKMKSQSQGFSLLEVILALAILAGSMAVLGQLIRFGFRNARQAQNLTEAQMICQTLMDEVIVGLKPVDPVTQVPIDMDSELYGTLPASDSTWVYSIDWEPSSIEGLIAVNVLVERANVTSLNEYDHFSLIRWIPDPEMELEEQPDSSDPDSTAVE
ncbi:MAG: type IV pilus modification PilV family protein [Pirellulales bacterium]